MKPRGVFPVVLGLWLLALPKPDLPALAALPAAAARAGSHQPDWTLVRSVANPAGGTIDFVLIPVRKQRDTGYYRRVAARVCGQRDTALVFFWTERTHIPESAWISVNDLRVMTAQYERHPSYKAPSLRLAHWLYPTDKAARQARVFYAP